MNEHPDHESTNFAGNAPVHHRRHEDFGQPQHRQYSAQYQRGGSSADDFMQARFGHPGLHLHHPGMMMNPFALMEQMEREIFGDPRGFGGAPPDGFFNDPFGPMGHT